MPDVPLVDGASLAGAFLTDEPAAARALHEGSEAVVRALLTHAVPSAGAWSGRSAVALAATAASLDPLPDEGSPLTEVLDEVGSLVLAHGVRPAHPWVAAHLHCPTLLSAAVAELAVGATNQSMDSFDQAPAATYVEDALVRRLAALVGLPAGAGGVLTAGGTASNLLGLALARERAARQADLDVADRGMGGITTTWRIVTSRLAHFSVQRAAAVLGLGRSAVVPVDCDDAGRIDVAATDRALARLDREGATVVAVVATAGTTDHGAVDDLGALGERARSCGAWYHVDACVGAGLAFSDRLRGMLAGIEAADSATADLHKLGWQPIGASALLVRDAGLLGLLTEHHDYLNRAEDEADGVLNLASRSLDTSRRFDALKILVSLRATGRRRLAAMVERCVDTAAAAAGRVRSHPELELIAPVSTVSVLFRCAPPDVPDSRLDELQVEVQRSLLDTGVAVLGRTRVGDRTALKLTILNPTTSADDVVSLLDRVAAEAARARDAGWARRED